jgi:uncharacterized DUF497 family protein
VIYYPVERQNNDDKRHTIIYDVRMKPINWNSDKNMTLKAERGVSFEEVLVAISQGLLLNVVEHPNKGKYPNQLIFVVRIRGYAYLVPFVETDEEIFLKTVIPSRSATRRYISERKNHE